MLLWRDLSSARGLQCRHAEAVTAIMSSVSDSVSTRQPTPVVPAEVVFAIVSARVYSGLTLPLRRPDSSTQWPSADRKSRLKGTK